MRRALCQSPAQDIPETGGDCCCEDADDPPGDTLVGEHHRPLFGPFVWDIGMRAAVWFPRNRGGFLMLRSVER